LQQQKKENSIRIKFIFLIIITFFAFFTESLFSQEDALYRFRKECEKLFYNVNGVLGVADLQSEKIIITINKFHFISKYYKPGSIFKIITSIAALKSGRFSENTSFNCKGKEYFEDIAYSCWLKGGHGNLIFKDAITNSCNIFFYSIADKLDPEDIYNICDAFSLGKRTPFGMDGEGNAYFKKTYNRIDKYDICVGESRNLLVTPIQMLYMISVVAKRGKFLGSTLDLNSGNYLCLYDGLLNAVKFGTAKEANFIKYEIAGKTGTSSKSFGKKTNSWFVGFAPYNNPKIAIVVFLNYGRGAMDAAPMAKKVFRSYFSNFYPGSD
jgi:cell division protein FtsI/penicillin-binding protein 2